MNDGEPANPIRVHHRDSDTTAATTGRDDTGITTARWRRMAREISAWADTLEADSSRKTEAAARVGEICCREALAQRHCEQL